MNAIATKAHSLATKAPQHVSPSILPEFDRTPFTLDQELEPFGKWSSDTIWVPPKDTSKELARSMLEDHGLFSSREECWSTLVRKHRSKFTQVREIELSKASIRLPKSRLFVSVTEQNDFDKITDPIPKCVQTRLDEFLDGPGRKPGVRVYYLKPLCVEVGDDLVFTQRSELDDVIANIQREVFSQYRRMYLWERPGKEVLSALDSIASIPRRMIKHVMERKKRAIDAYHAKLEFNRRKAAMRVVKVHRKCRTNECHFQEVLDITKTPDRVDVIEQYAAEHKLTQAQKENLIMASAVTLPWFLALPLATYWISKITFVTLAPPIIVCDPAFVAEMPDSDGTVLKIGHFDEVRGVVHVEI
jgi:phage terminase Nu1 subunit (DNA packaging protein)